MSSGNEIEPTSTASVLFRAADAPPLAERTGFLADDDVLSVGELCHRHDIPDDGRVAGVRLFWPRRPGIYWAFNINFRAAKRPRGNFRHPVRVAGAARSPRSGRRMEFNPLWVHLDKKESTRILASNIFYLVSRGHRIQIASFLGPDEKQVSIKRLGGGAARRQARHRPTIRSPEEGPAEIGWLALAREAVHPGRHDGRSR